MSIQTGQRPLLTSKKELYSPSKADRAEELDRGIQVANEPKDIAILTGAGLTPGVGAFVNWATLGSNISDLQAKANIAGALANVAGTVIGIAGLATGNSAATFVGLSMLGTSALTAGLTAALD